MRRTKVLAAVLCAGLLVPGVAVATPSPTTVEHQTEVVSAKVVRQLSRQEVVDYLAGYELDTTAVRNGVDIYLLTYRTPGVDGRPTTASALVVLPRSGARTLRPVAWLHGTRVFRGDTGSLSDNPDRAASVLFAASGYATVVVLSPFSERSGPLPEGQFEGLRRFPGADLASQVETLRDQGSHVEVITPDADSRAAMGINQMDPATRAPSARAGFAQGKQEATRLTFR